MMMQGKAKNKHTSMLHNHCLMVTPLSIDDCLTRIRAMQHFDLDVNIKSQTHSTAEVQFVERHHFDIPLYIKSRLWTVDDGTYVTFERSTYPATQQEIEAHKATMNLWLIQITLGVIFASLVGITLLDIGLRLVFFGVCVFVLFAVIFKYRMNTLPPHQFAYADTFNGKKIEWLMQQRADMLRADLYDALYVDPTEPQYDELGDPYYVDTAFEHVRHTI